MARTPGIEPRTRGGRVDGATDQATPEPPPGPANVKVRAQGRTTPAYYFITLLLHCTGRDRPGVNAHARVFLLTAECWPWLPGPGARALAIPVQIYARTTINQFADGGTVRE